MLQKKSTLQLASGVQIIHYTLIGLSAFAKKNIESFNSDKENFYKLDGELSEARDETIHKKLNVSEVIADNPEFAIDDYDVSENDHVTVTEMAPRVFR